MIKPETKILKESDPEKKISVDFQEPEKIFTEDNFLASLDITPPQRREVRYYIKEIKDPKTPCRFLENNKNNLPPGVISSAYIKELVKEKFLLAARSDQEYFGLGDLTVAMDTFGIEEDFFKQESFLKIRQEGWIDRLTRGQKLDDPERHLQEIWGKPEDLDRAELARLKKEEELKYGKLSESDLDLNSPEIKNVALQGLVNLLFYFNFGHSEEEKLARTEEYKKQFNISDKEIEAAVISELKKQGLDNIERNNNLRRVYPYVNNFLNSPEAREIAKQAIINKLIDFSDASDLMKYFYIKKSEFDQAKIKTEQKKKIAESLQKRIKEKEGRYFVYDLQSAQQALTSEDLKPIFEDSNCQEFLIEAIGETLSSSWELKNDLSLFREFGISEDLIKKGALKAISFNISSSRGLEKELISKLQETFNFSSEEFKEGFTWGVLSGLERGGINEYEIERRQQICQVEEMADSPAIQKKLKEIYLQKVADNATDSLEIINKKFAVDWQIADRPARNEALKQVLTNSRKLAQFGSIASLRDFVDKNYPETHKVFLLSDPEIKKAAEDFLIRFPFRRDYSRQEKETFKNFCNYFNLDQEKIISEIKEKITGGSFVGRREERSNFSKYFPEINFREENEKCLALFGKKIIEEALENQDWESLQEIKKYQNTEAAQIINKKIIEQEANLKDVTKSSDVRNYAIDFLAHLSQGIIYLEDNYLEDLIQIYSETNDGKLFDLFQRRSELFNKLKDESRTAAFEKLIIFGEDSRRDNPDPRPEILKADSVAYLNANQSARLLQISQFTDVTEGLIQAIDHNLTPKHSLYNNFYNRLNGKEIGTENDTFEVSKFAISLKEFLTIGIQNPELKNLMKKESILRKLASDPGEIIFIKKLVQEIPSGLLVFNWEDIYDSLKNQPSEIFEQRKNLLKRLESFKNSWSLNMSFVNLFNRLESYTPEEQDNFFKLLTLKDQSNFDFTEKDWTSAILHYISATEEENRLNLNSSSKKKLIGLFETNYRDIALNNFQKDWGNFLHDKSAKFLPPDLFMIGRFVDDSGGAGNLKYVESLGNLISKFDSLNEDDKVAERTKTEIKELLSGQEKRIVKEKWTQDDRAEFYNLSHDIIEAAPSLYASFAPILEQLSPKEIKIFLKENFPLYQAQLITIQGTSERGGEDVANYKPRELVLIRQAIEDLSTNLKSKSAAKDQTLFNEKTRLVEVVKNSFKNRFGLLKVPTEFSKEDLRSVQNGIRYLGNITHRDKNKEAIIALYLGLELNNEWKKFRTGQEIKSEEYLDKKQAGIIRPILEEKKKSYLLPLEIANISPDQASRFQELLQEETSSSMFGNFQTVDIKLANIKRNIDELADPDIYEKQTEKDIINLLTKEGRLVGAVLAKTYASISGKQVEFSDQEKLIQTRLEIIYNVNSWTTSQVEAIQNHIQPFSLVSNMISKLEEERVEKNINELQTRLNPPDKIIKIFNQLGEDFKVESGALALSKDLSYLESLAVKDDNKLNPEDRQAVSDYLDSIKEKMKELEVTLDKIKEYFTKIRKSTHFNSHELLSSRLSEVEKIVNSENDNAIIVSHLTKDFNLIIENMRQCLGCLRKEANNDTNLTFGDYNKFFLINQSERDKGSMADEIVFFVPVKTPNGNQEMSFVMDRVYGSKLPDVLISNTLAVYKKYRTLKKEFPEAKLSVTISSAALSSVGLNPELMDKRLKEFLPDFKIEQFNNLSADVPESSLSDNYIEFGGGNARQAGKRELSASIIK